MELTGSIHYLAINFGDKGQQSKGDMGVQESRGKVKRIISRLRRTPISPNPPLSPSSPSHAKPHGE